jgi:hypothetical protein
MCFMSQRAVHEFDGKPVQQGLVGREFALGAEVAGILAERGAEELHPKAVHHHARGQRVLPRDEPPGEVEAIGGRGRRT